MADMLVIISYQPIDVHDVQSGYVGDISNYVTIFLKEHCDVACASTFMHDVYLPTSLQQLACTVS